MYEVEEPLSVELRCSIRLCGVEPRHVLHDLLVVLDHVIDGVDRELLELGDTNRLDLKDVEVLLVSTEDVSNVSQSALPPVGHVDLAYAWLTRDRTYLCR